MTIRRLALLLCCLGLAASFTAAALAAVFVYFTDGPYPFLWLALFLAILIFFRHHQNIARLLKGEEPRIGAKKA